MELNGTGDVTGYGTIFLNAPTSNTFLFYVPLVKKYERTFLNYKTQHIFLGVFFCIEQIGAICNASALHSGGARFGTLPGSRPD